MAGGDESCGPGPLGDEADGAFSEVGRLYLVGAYGFAVVVRPFLEVLLWDGYASLLELDSTVGNVELGEDGQNVVLVGLGRPG